MAITMSQRPGAIDYAKEPPGGYLGRPGSHGRTGTVYRPDTVPFRSIPFEAPAPQTPILTGKPVEPVEKGPTEGGGLGPPPPARRPTAAPVQGLQAVATSATPVNLPMIGPLRSLGNRIYPEDTTVLAGLRRAY